MERQALIAIRWLASYGTIRPGTKTRAEKHVTEEDGERYANSAEGEGFADDVSSSPSKWAMIASSDSERLTIFQGAVRVDLYGLQ